jgi:acetyl esterase
MTDTPIDAATRPAPFVRPDVRGFLDFLNAAPGPKTHEGDAATARQMFTMMGSVAELPLGELATIIDLAIPGPAGDIPARLFDVAASREPGPAMLFYHGGGFVIGDLDSHASACAEISRGLNMPVISVDYRLAPEHVWPAAPDDCEAAARWVAGNPAALGRTVTSLVVCGDSAGGNLAIVVAMALRDAPAAVPVIVQAPLYPATDMSREFPSYSEFAEGYLLTRDTMDWFADAYAADLAHARTSPLQAPLAGMPPAVVITASLDPIRDQGRAYAAALIEAGVPVVFREASGNIHGFLTIRQAIPSSRGDLAGYLAAVKTMIAETEAQRVMIQAAG